LLTGYPQYVVGLYLDGAVGLQEGIGTSLDTYQQATVIVAQAEVGSRLAYPLRFVTYYYIAVAYLLACTVGNLVATLYHGQEAGYLFIGTYYSDDIAGEESHLATGDVDASSTASDAHDV
jgi:hypothetical protein